MKFIDANWVEYSPVRWLTYDDVMLLPQHSKLVSRKDNRINLQTPFTSITSMSTPLVSANMDTVTEADMAIAMSKAGGYGILHRFYQSKYGNDAYDKFMSDIKKLHEAQITPAFSIGLNPEDFKVIEAVLQLTKRAIVCVDVAHGDQEQVCNHIHKLSLGFRGHIEIIGGNVATPEGVAALVQAGCHGIKIGIGGGSMCSTRIQTGHGVPNLSTIMHCRRAVNGLRSNVALIADGGIRNSGDIVKALAAGANSVMIGNLLAGTNECPGVRYNCLSGIGGTFYEENTEGNYKKYRGQSSKEFNEELGKTDVTPEGISTYVKYKGPVGPILADLIGGIRSGMTYSGAKTLKELFDKSIFMEISHAGLMESHPHGI